MGPVRPRPRDGSLEGCPRRACGRFRPGPAWYERARQDYRAGRRGGERWLEAEWRRYAMTAGVEIQTAVQTPNGPARLLDRALSRLLRLPAARNDFLFERDVRAPM